MKWPGVLALACAPLAIATVASFVWMGATSVAPDDEAAAATARAVRAASAVAPSDKEPRAAAALEGGDLLEGEGVVSSTAIPAASAAAPLQVSLAAWAKARDAARTLLRLDRAIRTGDPATLESTRAELAAFRQGLVASGPPDRERCQTALDDLALRLDQRLAAAKQQAEADTLYRDALTMLAEGRAEDALGAMRRCQDLYGPSIDAARTAAVRELARRAEFQVAVRRSRAHLAAAATPAQQAVVLAGFVERFGADTAWPAPEQAILVQCRRRLEQIRASIRAEEAQRSAEQSLSALDAAPPQPFDARLTALAEIVRKHPESQIDKEVHRRLGAWLEAALPIKQSGEDGRLEEAVSAAQEILRGYFQEVTLADGAGGYKRFDSAAQRERPTSDVGTLRRDQLAQLPGPSAPHRLVQRYDAARRKTLGDPARREHWTELASVCESLQRELAEYRKRPGAGGAGLSFADEARFAREVAAPAAWKTFEGLWRRRAGP